MKKITTMVIAFVFVLTMAGCDNTASSAASNLSDSSASSVTASASETAGYKVEKSLSSVKLTLPISAVTNQIDFDAKEYARKNGYKEVIVNDDNSVTITMSKKQYTQMLENIKKNIDNSLASAVNASPTPYIKSITSGEDYKTITVDVERAGFNAAGGSTMPYTIGTLGASYQQYLGMNPKCEVIVRDADTQETIFSIIYPVA